MRERGGSGIGLAAFFRGELIGDFGFGEAR